MRRLSRPALLAILKSIRGIQSAIEGRTLNEYANDWTLKHAVERGIEIISEASKRLPLELRDRHPEIPWKRIIGIGNILRHDYDEIKDRVIYDAVRINLPPLKASIIAIEATLDEPKE